MSRPTLARARESGGRWHGTVGKNVSQLKHCQTHHSDTGTKCPDFCLDSEDNGLFCHLWFLKQHCLLLLLLLNRRLQLQLEVKLHAFSARDLGNCRVVWWWQKKIKNQKKKNQKNSKKIIKKHGVRISEYSLVSLGVYSGTSLHCCAQPYSTVLELGQLGPFCDFNVMFRAYKRLLTIMYRHSLQTTAKQGERVQEFCYER